MGDGDIRGWKTLCSDMNWIDYHGMWAKRAKDGSFYVLRWTNMIDAMGERDCAADGIDTFECDIKRVPLGELPAKEVAKALECCGLYEGELGAVYSDSGDEIASANEQERAAFVKVEACIQYGLGEPLETFTSSKYPVRLRARARRAAEAFMKNASALQSALDRPVNAIGSTAREYGRGDYDTAMMRGGTPLHALMRKIAGVA